MHAGPGCFLSTFYPLRPQVRVHRRRGRLPCPEGDLGVLGDLVRSGRTKRGTQEVATAEKKGRDSSLLMQSVCFVTSLLETCRMWMVGAQNCVTSVYPDATRWIQRDVSLLPEKSFLLQHVCAISGGLCLSARWVVDVFRGSAVSNVMCETLVQRLLELRERVGAVLPGLPDDVAW